MRTAWEYLVVYYSASFTSEGSLPRAWKHEMYVRRPGTSEYEPQSRDDLVLLFNELGAEGWEMIGESVRESVIVTSNRGFNEPSQPIAIMWIFKRPVAE